jgi:hypothetical protein
MNQPRRSGSCGRQEPVWCVGGRSRCQKSCGSKTCKLLHVWSSTLHFPGRVREVRVARACAVGGCAGCAGPTPRHITRVLSSCFPPSTLGAIPRVSPHKLGGWSGCAHRQLSAPHTRKHRSWGARFASSFPRPRLQRGRCDCAGRHRRACGQLFLRTPRQCHPTPRSARHAVVAAVST